MDNYTEIKNKIRAMVGKNTPLLLTGKVKSVDGETCTVSIGDLTLTDVRLRSVINGEDSKLLITPATDSYVTIIDLSGDLRETEVIGYSEIETINIETESDIKINCSGNIVIKDGHNHGLVNIQELTDRLNQFVEQFNAHTHTVPNGSSSAPTLPITLPYFSKTQYEDTKVKH